MAVLEMLLISFPVPARYSVGWYSGRICGFLSGSLVLIVLLYEITTLYGRLLVAVLAQRREREARFMTGDVVSASIAHEVRQPCRQWSPMPTRGCAGLLAPRLMSKKRERHFRESSYMAIVRMR